MVQRNNKQAKRKRISDVEREENQRAMIKTEEGAKKTAKTAGRTDDDFLLLLGAKKKEQQTIIAHCFLQFGAFICTLTLYNIIHDTLCQRRKVNMNDTIILMRHAERLDRSLEAKVTTLSKHIL